MTDLIVMGIMGVVAYLVGMTHGHVWGRSKDQREFRRQVLSKPLSYCGCEHHLVFHDLATGKCHFKPAQSQYYDTCGCQQFLAASPYGQENR